jgi:hypothetical protein
MKVGVCVRYALSPHLHNSGSDWFYMELFEKIAVNIGFGMGF